MTEPLFHKAITPKMGEVAEFPTRRSGHRHLMRKQKNLSQVKEQYKANAGALSETDISNMLNRELNIVSIMILTGLEKNSKI